MKITCNSCGAKYTIADEKVVGRRVKVRCKSCKASILVDGTGGEGGADAGADEEHEEEAGDAVAVAPQAAPASPAGKAPPAKTVKKNTWSVNLSDDDSREMTTDELVQGWKDGTVSQDAYVWKDGMDDWKPILEVPELKLRLKAIAPKAKAEEGVVTSSKRAGAAAATGSDDLFGGVDFAGSGDAGASPAPIRGTASDDDKKAPTGQRNESSVLFSLDALRTQDPPAKDKAAPATAADIFGTGPSPGLGGFGGGGLGGGLDLLTAPAKDPPPAPVGVRTVQAVASPPTQQKGKGGLIAAILAGVLVLGGGAYLALGGSGDASEELAKAEAKAKEEAEAQAAAAKKATEEQAAKFATEKAAMEAKLKEAQAAAEKKDEPKKDEAAAAATTASTTTPAPAGTSKPTTGTPAATPTATPAPSGGGAFDTAAAKAALSAAAANTAACAQAGGPKGAGKVEVTFAPSGRVTSANVVSGPFGGTSVGGCIASTFKRAKIPAFSGSPTTVAKGFTIN